MGNISKINYSEGDKDYELYDVFAHARYLVFRAREKELQRYGLTPEQSQVLLVTRALKDKATPSEISRRTLRQPHSVSALIERMQTKGLVKKVKDLSRKNMVRVAMTKKGEEAYKLTLKRGPIHRIMNALNETERRQFQKHLEKIMTRAEDELGLNRDKLPPSE